MRLLNSNNHNNNESEDEIFKDALNPGRTLLPAEEEYDFRGLHNAFVREFRPKDESEVRAIAELTHHHWLCQRANILQMEILSTLETGHNPGPAFTVFLRYQVVNERSYERVLSRFLVRRKEAELALKANGRPRRDPKAICLMWTGENGNAECMPGFEDRFDLGKWRRFKGDEPVNIPPGYVPKPTDNDY